MTGFESAAQAQTFPPTVPWDSAPGAAAFQSGTAGVGPFVDVVADLPVRADFSLNSWWAGGYFDVSGQKIGYIYHVLLQNTPQGLILLENVSVTNVTTGSYYALNEAYPLLPDTIGPTGFNIVTPTSSIQGDFDNLHVIGNVNGAKYDLRLRAASKGLFNGGTGLYPMLGSEMRQYSVPLLATTGSLTIGNRTYSVTGNSWFDRQWGNDSGVPPKWLWLGINLTNGDALSVWSFQDLTLNQPRTFATILHKDGSQTVAAAVATPDPNSTWQSTGSGNVYPLKWNIEVPQLNTSLVVVSSPKNQEFVMRFVGGAYEGLSNVTGIYKGSSVLGVARLEMLGAFNDAARPCNSAKRSE